MRQAAPQPQHGASSSGYAVPAVANQSSLGLSRVVSLVEEAVVLGRYRMSIHRASVVGEGTSSICRKGIDSVTGEPVAIKVYRDSVKDKGDVLVKQFQRQVKVLQKLREPFEPVVDQSLWHSSLEKSSPSKLFMLLVDYSKDEALKPGTGRNGDVLYVVTELGQYSLKDFLNIKRDEGQRMDTQSVRNITRSILLVVAGLHAKGLVHMDLKPDNLMIFEGYLKLIDVDGCVTIGTDISIQDPSIAFSACYCSPEWATFLTSASDSKISANPALDVWSVGMTLAELVVLTPVMKPMYGHFLQNSRYHREAGFLFMDWLKGVEKVPLPKSIHEFDEDFLPLLREFLLVPDCSKRKTCAQCLDHPFLLEACMKKRSSLPREELVRTHRARPLTGKNKTLYNGRVWKLNGDRDDRKDWIEHDMWLAQQGSLCYFSTADHKGLVLIDAHSLRGARIALSGLEVCRGTMFEITFKDDEDNHQVVALATESAKDAQDWVGKLQSIGRMDIPTMHLGSHVAELREYMLSVKNRRQHVDDNAKEHFAPVFKEKLWKLIADGDRNNEAHWREREVWISKNGSLVYKSEKEGRDLVYYTTVDLLRATYSIVPAEDSCKPFTFQVILAQADGIDVAPGDFAANTCELRTKWMEAFRRGGATTR